MHKIAAQIIEQKGEYILSLKGNQGNLYKVGLFSTGASNGLARD